MADKEKDPEDGNESIELMKTYNIDPKTIKGADEYAKVMSSNDKRL